MMITVIIPTYNRPIQLKRAIDSVLSQNYTNFEILILDNCSSIETEILVNKYLIFENRIKYLRHDINIGGVKNFIFGQKLVKTEFFCFLSDDDYYLPIFFETAINAFKKYPNIGYFAGEVIFEDSAYNIKGQSNKFLSEGYYNSKEGLYAIVKNTHPPCWTGILFKTSIIKNVGFLDEETGGSIDYDYVNRVSSLFPFFISSNVVAKFSIDLDSWGHSSNYKFVWPSWNKLIFNIISNNKIDLQTRLHFYKFYNNIFKEKLYLYARQSIKNHDYISAIECALILKVYFNSYYYYNIIKYSVIVFKHFSFIRIIYMNIKRFNNSF